MHRTPRLRTRPPAMTRQQPIQYAGTEVFESFNSKPRVPTLGGSGKIKARRLLRPYPDEPFEGVARPFGQSRSPASHSVAFPHLTYHGACTFKASRGACSAHRWVKHQGLDPFAGGRRRTMLNLRESDCRPQVGQRSLGSEGRSWEY